MAYGTGSDDYFAAREAQRGWADGPGALGAGYGSGGLTGPARQMRRTVGGSYIAQSNAPKAGSMGGYVSMPSTGPAPVVRNVEFPSVSPHRINAVAQGVAPNFNVRPPQEVVIRPNLAPLGFGVGRLLSRKKQEPGKPETGEPGLPELGPGPERPALPPGRPPLELGPGTPGPGTPGTGTDRPALPPGRTPPALGPGTERPALGPGPGTPGGGPGSGQPALGAGPAASRAVPITATRRGRGMGARGVTNVRRDLGNAKRQVADMAADFEYGDTGVIQPDAVFSPGESTSMAALTTRTSNRNR